MISRGIGKSAARSVARSLSQFGSGGGGVAFNPTIIPGLVAWHNLTDATQSLSSVSPESQADEFDSVVKVLDASGNLNTLTDTTGSVPRKLQFGIHQEGTQQLNYTASSLGILKSKSGFSFATIVSSNTIAANTTQFLLGFSTAGSVTSARVVFGVARSGIKYFFGGRREDSDSFVDIDSNSDVILNIPALVIGVVDYANASITLRVNGVQEATGAFHDAGTTDATDSLVASVFRFSNQPVVSHWNQVAIWDRAISSEEISKIESQANGWLAEYVRPNLSVDYHLQDGIRNQWVHPSGISVSGTTYTGAVSSTGVVSIQAVNESTGAIQKSAIATIQIDDHNAPALLLNSTKPWFIFYANHGTDTTLRCKKSTTGISGWGTEIAITTPSNVTYAQAYRCSDGSDPEGRVICFFRQRPNWGFVYTDDEGSTFSSVQDWIGSTTNDWMYHATKMKSDGQTLAVAVHTHPVNGDDQDIYYCELNLQTGVVSRPDTGGVLGNIYDAGTLPIDYLTAMKVYDSVGTTRTRLLDVSKSGEVLIARWDGPYDRNDAVISYFSRTGSSWSEVILCGAGSLLDDPGGNERAYIGGGCFSEVPGEIYIATDEGSEGFWEIRKYSVSGSSASYEKINNRKYPTKRFRPVVPVNASSSYPVFWSEGYYANFTDYFTNLSYEKQ